MIKLVQLAICFTVAFSAGSAAFFMNRKPSLTETLPVYGIVEPFLLLSQDGKPVTVDSLKGSVHIVNFIFTSCRDICPLLTQRMADLQARTRSFGSSVKLLSISVDPRHDTPAVLKTYAEKFQADFSRWTFATGTEDSVQKLVVNGFMTALYGVGAKGSSKEGGLTDITHGANFVIVDQAGRIRAFRHANDERELEDIVAIVHQLARTSNRFASR